MRCKVGDLVIVVKTHPHWADLLGHVVTIVGLSTSYPGQWRTDGTTRTGNVICGADECFRPIRPGEGEDETLTWAPRKEGVTA